MIGALTQASRKSKSEGSANGFRMCAPGESAVRALLLACALVLAVGGAQAQAAPKSVFHHFGSAGSGAGQFTTPTGVAVNETTGDVYVVDSGHHRIQRFDHDGDFELAWGYDVDPDALSGTGFETCTVLCKAGVPGAGAGQLASPQGIAVDQDTQDVFVTDQGNNRIEQFDEDGEFVRAWGWDVQEPAAAPGTAAFEICGVTDSCRQGATGSGAGQFGTSMGHLAVDPRNSTVVVADRTNRRVQRFDGTSGAFLMAFGAAGSGVGQFATNQPSRVAVDSAGFVSTVESTASGQTPRRVQKFSPDGTSAAVFAPDRTSGTSNATAPTDVAVDPETDRVVVVKNTQAPEVLEFDIAGGLADTHAAGAGLPAANGLAVSGSTGRIYISTTPDQRVFVLGTPTPPPSATIAATDQIDATSARLKGTVNPNGGGVLVTSYHFEYSDDAGATWERVPEDMDVDVGNDMVPHDVSQVATGLEPNTQYLVRLVASRPFGGGSDTSDGSAGNFTTALGAPTVSGEGASEITDTTAVLGGRIDANHSHTTYRFEYGTDTGYGRATAVDSAGSGETSVPVSQPVTGLQPNTTYHFRLVATNAGGQAAGPDATFTTAAQPIQPSGRAYEMVSPVDKNGGDIARVLGQSGLSLQTGASASGDRAAFVSFTAFGDLEASPGVLSWPNYAARRSNTGWVTEAISPPMSGAVGGQIEASRVVGLSPDLSNAFAISGALLTSDAATLNGSWGLYVRGIGQPDPYRLLSIRSANVSPNDPDTNTTVVARRFDYEASTPDSRHVVFNSNRRLLQTAPDGTTPAPPDDDTLSSSNAVYEWVDGNVRLASVLPPGMEFEAGESVEVVAGGGQGRIFNGDLHGDHIISDDGRRIFFTAEAGPLGGQAGDHLFVREDGTATRLLSRPGSGPVVPPVPRFWSAKSSDGSVAFFTSQTPLTPGGPTGGVGGLYRWDANDSDGQPLTELTENSQPGLLGPTAISDDATHVYFVATANLASGATVGEPNLYLWREGQEIRHIASLGDPAPGVDQLDSMMWRLEWELTGGRAARVSADGERLLFASYAPLGGATHSFEDNPEACGDPAAAGDRCRQVYLYDASSDDIRCLTCAPGVPLSDDANLYGNADGRRGAGEPLVHAPLNLPQNLSADGTRAFFESARALVSRDQNSAVDVYEWVDRDLDGEGELNLISSGQGGSDSLFLDASLSGDDVFFTTRDQLVGIDDDNLVDLYDARVGGGIAAQNPPPATSCQGEACQGAFSGAPALPGVGSGGPGHGDLRLRPRPAFSVGRLSRRERTRLARGQRVSLTVRVNQAGRVSATARAKLGKRMRAVDRSAKAARRAGRVKLPLMLSGEARRALARNGTLSVRLAVRFTGVREARTSTLRLQRAPAADRRRAR
jgi:NHL repeat